MSIKIDRFYTKHDIKTSAIYDRCEDNYSIVRVNTYNTKFNKELVELLLPIIDDCYEGKLNMKEGIDEKIVRKIQDFINYWRI